MHPPNQILIVQLFLPTKALSRKTFRRIENRTGSGDQSPNVSNWKSMQTLACLQCCPNGKSNESGNYRGVETLWWKYCVKFCHGNFPCPSLGHPQKGYFLQGRLHFPTAKQPLALPLLGHSSILQQGPRCQATEVGFTGVFPAPVLLTGQHFPFLL